MRTNRKFNLVNSSFYCNTEMSFQNQQQHCLKTICFSITYFFALDNYYYKLQHK